MVNTTEEFVFNFHSLTGETIAERRKNFRILLNKTKQSLKDGPEEIDFSRLRPKNPFEETLKVETLIYFRKVPDLLDVLKSENPIHIAKVLKVSPAFLAEAFENVSGKELIQQIFPLLSFNTKLKLVNKLALHLKDTKQAEEFFEAIRQNYGLHLASKLLSGCSGDFIVKSIKANRTEITPAQLMVIIKKHPGLTETLLEELNDCHNKIGIAEKYKTVFVYLMQTNAPLFLKLNEKYHPTFCLGGRSTKTFIRSNKQNVVNDSKKIYKLLKRQQVFRSLKHDFKDFYFNLFPKTLSECEEEYETLLSLLEHTPSDWKKVNLLLETFKNVHGDDLWAYPKLVTAKLIEAMSPDDREIWMQHHSRPNEILEEEWISYMKTEKSLPLLKERIALTANIKARVKLVVYLVTTCKINRDKAALGDVCKYMATKHHNDHHTVRQKFLSTVKNSFGLAQLDGDQWMSINELLQFGVFNNEYFYENSEFLRAYIKYRLDKNLPVTEELLRWVKFKYYRLSFDEPKYETQYLPMLGDMIGLGRGRNEDELTYASVDFLNHLSCWNETHPKHQISLLPYTTAINYFKSSLKTDKHSSGLEKIILQFIQANIAEEEILEMLNDFFTLKNSWTNGNLLNWLLINKPMYIRNNIKPIANVCFKGDDLPKLPSMLMRIKNYAHLGIPQKMCEIFVEKIKMKQEDEDIRNYIHPNGLECAVTALSYLMDANDFINLISPYYPSTLTLDMQSLQGRWIGKVQKAIVASVRNIIPPSVALESVLHFSKGDYLAFVQKSLYSVSYNTAEAKLPPFLEELSTRAVSVRKYSIYLTVGTSKKKQICDMFRRLVKTEKNSSIRKCLFKGAFNSFIKFPDDYSWELLKEIVVSLDVNDNEAFNILTKWKRIPRAYIQCYIVFTWGMLDNLPNSTQVEEKRCKILEAITPSIISVLPKEFCTQVIKKYLFKSSQLDIFQTKILSFTSWCIIYSKSELERQEYLEFTFSQLKNFVTSSWYDSKSCIFGRASVFNFIKTFCSEFLEKKCSTVEILRNFIRLWNHFLKSHDALDIHLHLQFTLIYLECSTLSEIGELLLMLYEWLLKLNGPVIIDSFNKTLKLFLKQYLVSDVADVAEENRYILVESIMKMKNGDSANRFMLTIFLMPDKIPSTIKIKSKYEATMAVLLKEHEPSVQIYLDKYLQLFSSSDQ